MQGYCEENSKDGNEERLRCDERWNRLRDSRKRRKQKSERSTIARPEEFGPSVSILPDEFAAFETNFISFSGYMECTAIDADVVMYS